MLLQWAARKGRYKETLQNWRSGPALQRAMRMAQRRRCWDEGVTGQTSQRTLSTRDSSLGSRRGPILGSELNRGCGCGDMCCASLSSRARLQAKFQIVHNSYPLLPFFIHESVLNTLELAIATLSGASATSNDASDLISTNEA